MQQLWLRRLLRAQWDVWAECGDYVLCESTELFFLNEQLIFNKGKEPDGVWALENGPLVVYRSVRVSVSLTGELTV